MKKLITEQSNEELLKQLEGIPTNNIYIESSQEILEFISVFKLQNGTNPVKMNTLFNLYKLWSKSPKTLVMFNKDLSEMVTKEKSYYYINFDVFTLKKEIHKLQTIKYATTLPGRARHFKQFLSRYQIKNGGLWIKDLVLYNIYDKWTYKNNSNNPLSLPQFNRFCNNYFKSKRINKHYWYKLNKSIQQYLTEDLIALMKDNNEKTTNKKKRS